jgi:hypothetical protein
LQRLAFGGVQKSVHIAAVADPSFAAENKGPVFLKNF